MISIWQIYFSEQTKKSLDSGFIPYNNTNKCTQFFENEVIIDIYKNRKDIWLNSEYVGILSWIFKQKTSLNSSDIFSKIYKDKESYLAKDVYLLTPKKYMMLVPTTHKTSFKPVVNIAKL